MADRIHTNNNYTGVGMIEVVNEPVQDTSQTATMISEFYPKAYDRIRAAEDAAGVASEGQLHIQMMVGPSTQTEMPLGALVRIWLTDV